VQHPGFPQKVQKFSFGTKPSRTKDRAPFSAAASQDLTEETPLNRQTHPSRRARTLRSPLRLSPVAAGAAAMLLSLGAQAQQSPGPSTQPAADASQTITVTGIRRGIENAINVKKNNDSIVEAVSAEDIGKLPDSSIAESIARLPGLAAQTVNGRAKEISIRGLSGQFANTLLNGREQTSTNNNRSVEFDQYPSELLSSVLVYKTPDASLMGQGIAGTIDLQTVRPLSFGQRTFAINVRGEKNGKGTPFPGDGSRFNLAYIDQFADRTIGVALGFARLKQNTEKIRTETYDTTNINCLAADSSVVGRTGDPSACPAGTQQFVHNQGFKYFVDSNKETRDGAMAVLEFKPNKSLSSTVDVFYSKFDKEFVKRGLEIQVGDSWKSGSATVGYQAPQLNNAVFGPSGELQSGVWSNVNPLSRHIWEPRNDELNSIGWNTKWKFADKWQAAADLSYSSAKSTNRITEIEAGQFDVANNRPLPEDVTVRNYNQIASLQYDRSNLSTMRLTDPESWGQNGYDKIISTDDKLKALRLSAQRDLEGVFSRIDFGVNHTKRDKEKGSAEAFLRLPERCSDGGDAGATPPRAPVPAGCTPGINPSAPLPSGTSALAIPGSGLTTISFDPAAALSAYRFDANVNGDILRKGWTVNEKVTTLFTKADLDTQLFGLPMRGNVGLQLVRSDQSSTAPVVGRTGGDSIGSFVTRTDGKTYTDLLPTANLIFDLSGDQILRVGAGRQMARPRMDDLTAFSRTEVNGSNRWEGNGGNPQLDPYRANAFDVSYEKYFGTKGYVSAAAFYKDLKSWILRLPEEFDFTGSPNLSGRTASSPLGLFTRPKNLTGGKLSGFELSLSLPLNLVTPVLDGFGVQGSFARTNSSIKPFAGGPKFQIPGFSREVTTLTAYYEKYGFSARIATRDRAPFIAEVEGFGGDREFPFVRREQITDLQLGYELQSGPAKGLNFLLQVNNLDNETYREYNPNTNLDTKVDKYGRTYLFGVTYKF
jgi:iron complex outermembrane recepter protein